MNTPLKIPMMMYGRFRRERAKRDENGNTLKDKKGNYIKEKYWKVHSEEAGDPGVYPSVNHVYTRMAKGRQRLIKPAEDLFQKWAECARKWASENDWVIESGKVIIEMTAYFPQDNRERDTHNAFKLMLDAFQGILYKRDSTVLARTMDYHKVRDGEKPYFELNIYKKDQENEVMRERYQKAN